MTERPTAAQTGDRSRDLRSCLASEKKAWTLGIRTPYGALKSRTVQVLVRSRLSKSSIQLYGCYRPHPYLGESLDGFLVGLGRCFIGLDGQVF